MVSDQIFSCRPQVWYDVQSYQKHHGPQTLYLPVTLSSVSVPDPSQLRLRLPGGFLKGRQHVLWGPVPACEQKAKLDNRPASSQPCPCPRSLCSSVEGPLCLGGCGCGALQTV